MAEELARWITLKEFAELTQISLTTAYAEVRSGRLRAAHVAGGRSIRVTPDALRDYERLCSGDLEQDGSDRTAAGLRGPAAVSAGGRGNGRRSLTKA